MRFQDDAGNDHIGSAIKFTDEPAQIDTQLPKVGADSATIIAELDLTESDREAILGSLNSNVRTTGKS
jgi:crotonobetainyl-CoA:carnitine CoA-transferase CaiB-like acyl-CoA transferase